MNFLLLLKTQIHTMHFGLSITKHFVCVFSIVGGKLKLWNRWQNFVCSSIDLLIHMAVVNGTKLSSNRSPSLFWTVLWRVILCS